MLRACYEHYAITAHKENFRSAASGNSLFLCGGFSPEDDCGALDCKVKTGAKMEQIVDKTESRYPLGPCESAPMACCRVDKVISID